MQRQLFYYSYMGCPEKVQELLDQGAPINATYEADSRTVLHAAAQAGRVEVVQLLIKKGANVNARTSKGCTPLHLAAGYGHAPAAAALLECGASLDATDDQGWTPLHHAARGGRTALIRLLLDAGASINALSTDLETPLHCACVSRICWAVEELLARGAAVDKQDIKGRTPVHISASDGFLNIVQLLLDAKAPVDARDADGRTPLLEAAKCCQADVVQGLLQRGARADARDNSGNTAIHLVALGHHSIKDISGILQAPLRACINTRNNTGRTPLHIALEGKQLEYVMALLAAGADAGVPYGVGAAHKQGGSIPEGTSPLQRASQIEFTSAKRLLTKIKPSNLDAKSVPGGHQPEPSTATVMLEGAVCCAAPHAAGDASSKG